MATHHFAHQNSWIATCRGTGTDDDDDRAYNPNLCDRWFGGYHEPNRQGE